MAASCPPGQNADRLRERVRGTYDRLARSPRGDFLFHRGRDYAAELLGYDRAELATLPALCVERFAGVGNPLRIGPLRAGETVLDHACGAGLDLLLAARRVGPGGHAVGVDMTPSMREHVLTGAAEAGLTGLVEVRGGLFEDLPVASASVDVVISNGVVNLSPDKPRVFREIARVLRPGGRLYLADVTVPCELALRVRGDCELWAACIAGALAEPALHELVAAAGLTGGRIVGRFDCFGGKTTCGHVARELGVRSVNFIAKKERS